MKSIQQSWELRYLLPGTTNEQIFSRNSRGLSSKDNRLYLRIIQLNHICVIENVGTHYQVGIYRNGETRLVDPKKRVVLQINDKVCFRPLNSSFESKEVGWNPQHYLKVVRTKQNFTTDTIHNESRYLLELLPEIYQSIAKNSVKSDTTLQLLSIIEHVLLPLQWSIYDADIYFRLGTTPKAIYSWLALFTPTVSTKQGMERLLRFVSGSDVIIKTEVGGSFVVEFQSEISDASERELKRIIEDFKPVGVNYRLERKKKI